ncbi:MAG TPA: hypothetical protein VG101_10775 [Puia sp.]|jgi:hypothetical protein|nr:hypothetical protein [Puia sp.]
MQNYTIEDGRQVKKIRGWVICFMIFLVLSGVTAFALETEMSWLVAGWPFARSGALFGWIWRVYAALRDSSGRYPFLAYGYDWLAFAHLVIAVAFIGPLRDPVRNKWVIEFGMIACVMVFPLAFIAGAVRGIPIYWRLIDCSFGVVGLVLLSICYRAIRNLERMRRG